MERTRLTASEIEEELLAELLKLPTLHDTQSVMIRPCSGPKCWTCELDRIEPEVGPTQIKFVAGRPLSLDCSNNTRSQPSSTGLRTAKRRSEATHVEPADLND